MKGARTHSRRSNYCCYPGTSFSRGSLSERAQGGRALLPCPLIREAYVDKPTLKCKTKATQRLDIHLVKTRLFIFIFVSSIRSVQASILPKGRQTYTQEQQSDIQITFDEIVKKYTGVNEGRSMVKKQTASTSVETAFARHISEKNKHGKIDTLVSGKKIKPRTIQVYLASVRKFLFWLSQAQEVLDRLQVQQDFVCPGQSSNYLLNL